MVDDLQHRDTTALAEGRARWAERALGFAHRPMSAFDLAAGICAVGATVGWIAGWLTGGEFLTALVAAIGIREVSRFFRKVLWSQT